MASLDNDLQQIGHKLKWWRAQLALVSGLAAVLGAACLFALFDIFCQYGRMTRFVCATILLSLVIATGYLLRRVMSRKITPEGIAATLERAFPQLDNHLINYIQFSRDTSGNPFKKAYVGKGKPSYRELEFQQMKNRKAHLISYAALASVLLLVLGPALFMGRSWGTALWRSVNPFTSTPPASLTRILDVTPGDTTVVQGSPVLLVGNVQGRRNHEVWVDVDPADADKTTYTLGLISAGTPLDFSHRIPRVTTQLRYRFRAGDSPAGKWHTVKTRPPPAFTDIKLTLTPPPYTAKKKSSASGWDEDIRILHGTTVDIIASCNVPVNALELQRVGGDSVPMQQVDGSATKWKSGLVVQGGNALRLVAEDRHGDPLEQAIGYVYVPDDAPTIEITRPRGQVILAPGEAPSIAFSVIDDHGLAEVSIERVKLGAGSGAPGELQQRWPLGDTATFDNVWKGTPEKNTRLAFRLIAQDNREDKPQTIRSPTIIFNVDSHKEVADRRNELEGQAFTSLNKVITLQRQNIDQTKAGRAGIDSLTGGFWEETAARQGEIRDLTKKLLTNPIKPLGSLTSSIQKLYLNEMAEAVSVLTALPRSPKPQRLAQASRAEILEASILRQLTRAESSAGTAKVERRMSGLTSMLKKLINGQSGILKQTQNVIQQAARPAGSLVDAQDDLALDLTEFRDACRREAGEVQANDATYAQVITSLADRCVSDGIRNDMVIAAERLDENAPTEAVTFETTALAKLKNLDALLNSVVAQEAQADHEAMVEGVQQAQEKLKKIKDLHERMLEAMELTRDQKDKSDDDRFDMMEEDFEELVRNTKESLLEVPTDLHVFTDLNVANDVVEDVFAVFQEVEQVFDKDKGGDPKNAIEEAAFAKEEALLDAMEEAEGRIDDVEMWLGEKADTTKVTTETLDQEEMPEAGIALGALAAAVEDLIGELLEEEEDVADEADDGATTHAMGDLETGWEVMEGNISSFAAKGKSGNDTPDHKEQDGRSNVGRQGMSVGETAAGSGTIGEGDKNIEERRTSDPTQSGQVNLDGEADTKATGGGKLATGKADELGMGGGVKRMDSNEAGSWEGMAALMAREADAVFAKASMKNIRADALKDAAHHLRQSGDAIAKGNIRQVREFRKLAIASLQNAQAQLAAGPAAGFAIESNPGVLGDVVDSGPDLAPAKYRDEVANYYKRLNEAL
ncbi:MAG: hypothetical protein HN341_06385 [Verrucomicrobia bacterium]|nr:hypothetical protein [Verrucomicrobiota bacterium]